MNCGMLSTVCLRRGGAICGWLEKTLKARCGINHVGQVCVLGFLFFCYMFKKKTYTHNPNTRKKCMENNLERYI